MPRKGYKTKKMLEEEIRDLKAELESSKKSESYEKTDIAFGDSLSVVVIYQILGIPKDKYIHDNIIKDMRNIGCSYVRTVIDGEYRALVFHRD